MNYALIENGIVSNIIVLAPYNATEFPGAVPLGDKPVGIGDTYRDGKFWRDGEEILSARETETRDLQRQITDLDLANIEAQQQITDYDLKALEGAST